MKILQRNVFVLFVLLLGSLFYSSLSQATSLSNQGEKKVDDGSRFLISQLDYLNDADYVKTIWYNILGREVDDYGVGMHVQILTSKQQTRQQMRENIARGEESQMRINDIYNRYLYRDATPSERRIWTERLGNGTATTFDVETRLQSYVNNGGK